MVYDVFPFFNELELLEIRLNELSSVVDKFILSEATTTHSNKPKRLYFQENKERFAAFQDRIISIVVDLPDGPDHWVREKFQRDQLKGALSEAGVKPNDVIISCDLDEVPRASSFQAALPKIDTPRRFVMTGYYYWANSPTGDDWCTGLTTRFKHINGTLSELRNSAWGHENRIENGGWHLSYMCGLDRVYQKLESFAHQELNHDGHKADIARWFSVDPGGKPLAALPDYLMANREKFAFLFKNPPE